MSDQNFPHTDKFRTLFGIASAVLFIVVGSLLIKNSEEYGVNPLLIKGLGIVVIMFFGGVLARRIRLYFRSRK